MTRPSAWGMAWSNFWASITKTSAAAPKRYVGVDQFGNKFYEFAGRGASSNVKRGYEHGPNPDILPTVEWESWIKGTRRFPPSDEEIAINQSKQEAQLTQDSETERRAPHISSEGKGAADVDRPTKFPEYKDDIELAPGAKKHR